MADNRVMPPGSLIAWREQMNLNSRDAATILGASRHALLGWEKNGAPLYIAYACAAILAELKPYKTKAANTRIPA